MKALVIAVPSSLEWFGALCNSRNHPADHPSPAAGQVKVRFTADAECIGGNQATFRWGIEQATALTKLPRICCFQLAPNNLLPMLHFAWRENEIARENGTLRVGQNLNCGLFICNKSSYISRINSICTLARSAGTLLVPSTSVRVATLTGGKSCFRGHGNKFTTLHLVVPSEMWIDSSEVERLCLPWQTVLVLLNCNQTLRNVKLPSEAYWKGFKRMFFPSLIYITFLLFNLIPVLRGWTVDDHCKPKIVYICCLAATSKITSAAWVHPTDFTHS